MEKPVPTDFDIHPLLKRRWSPRAFLDKQIETAALQRIFEAARWAPSSGNEQPWRFFIGIKNDDTWQKIFQTLDDGNQRWCKYAPVLVLAVAAKNFSRNGKDNKHKGHDVGQAMSHITFQAMHENVFVHQMAGFDAAVAQNIFGIPNDYEPFTAASLGYVGEPEQLPEDLAKREISERKRKPINEISFSGQWENAFDFNGKTV